MDTCMNCKELVLVVVDECGDEWEENHYFVPAELDDFALQLWEDKKEQEMRERYPEAMHFYFEDRSRWHSLMVEMDRNPSFEPWLE